MAFNFNWSPLAADTSFYTRAQDLLTAALNKSPKPPIIVDDILVHELNLGSVPPDLEILEVGDLAEDRFRGIFKMRYSGDAFLTLKTRVQANPLNTYLSTRPSFASPEPLAAASGLTIPLKITLSDIKLSAFIILVFSKQKGLTLVFRNDPLESLKVSSTFDSISFVRDYLQKEIEQQLRTLLMDEVPAIIHRLSLRLWVPEYRAREDDQLAQNPVKQEETVTDPFASPPQDPVDSNGNVLDATQIASLSLDSSAETQSLFSQKNLLRLAALTDSHRTLSLFSPGMRDVVFRAWAGQLERGEATGIHSPYGSSISLKHNPNANPSTTYTFSNISDAGSQTIRPSLANFGATHSGTSFGRHSKPGKKRKRRVVNLRKPKTGAEDGESVSGESSMSATLSSAGTSDNGLPRSIPEDRELELVTPPQSPRKLASKHPLGSPGSIDLSASPQKLDDTTPRPPLRARQNQYLEPKTTFPVPTPSRAPAPAPFESGPPPTWDDNKTPGEEPTNNPLSASTATIRPKPPSRFFQSWQQPPDTLSRSASTSSLSQSQQLPVLSAPFPYTESSPGGILEQAWMMRMAGEIARRVAEQKGSVRDAHFWDGDDGGREGEEAPPPAYAS